MGTVLQWDEVTFVEVVLRVCEYCMVCGRRLGVGGVFSVVALWKGNNNYFSSLVGKNIYIRCVTIVMVFAFFVIFAVGGWPPYITTRSNY